MISFFILLLLNSFIVTASLTSEIIYQRHLKEKWRYWYFIFIIFLFIDSNIYSFTELLFLLKDVPKEPYIDVLFYMERTSQVFLEILFILFFHHLLNRKTPKAIIGFLIGVILVKITYDFVYSFINTIDTNDSQLSILAGIQKAVDLVRNLLFYFYCLWIIIFRRDIDNKREEKSFMIFISLGIIFFSIESFNKSHFLNNLPEIKNILSFITYPLFCASWFLYRFIINYHSIKILISPFQTYQLEHISESLSLTNRQMEIISLLQEGKTATYIAETLFISERTVQNHIYKIYKIFNVNSRMALIDELKKTSITI